MSSAPPSQMAKRFHSTRTPHGPWAAPMPSTRVQKIKQFRSGPDPANSATIDDLGPWVFPSEAIREYLYTGSDGAPAASWDAIRTDRKFVGGSRTVWVCTYYNDRGEIVCTRDGLRLVGRFSPFRVYFKARKD